MAHGYFAVGRSRHAASLQWLAAGRENRKDAGNVIFAAKLRSGGAARSPDDGADRIVFNSDRETFCLAP
jgi:hypothetical protein